MSHVNAQYIEEVIVSAQKVDQNLQVVPVAVSAYSGQLMFEANVKDIFDLQNMVPGLRVGQNQSATTSNFNIRGVGTSGSNFGLESSVGLYVDGVWRARQNAMISNLVDMEAVEVLRGPQGTLFGKNTPSGAILFKTKKPTQETEGFIDLSAGTYNLLGASGAISSGLIEDVLAFRLSGFTTTRDGVANDLVLGDETINDRDREGVRGQLLYTPNDRFALRFIADYAQIDEHCCAAITLVDSLFANARPGPIPGTDSLIRLLGGSTTTTAEFDDYNMALNHLPLSQSEDSGYSVEMTYDFDNYSLTSITGWRRFDTYDDIDIDFTNLPIFNRVEDSRQKAFSQEIRLSNDPANRLRYILGLYYFTQDLDNDSTIATGPAMNAFITSAPSYQSQVQLLINAISQASVNTGGIVPMPVAPFTSNGSSLNQMRQNHESLAYFGQMEFDLVEDLMLTLGLRYTEEDKTLVGQFSQSATGAPPNTLAALTQLGILQTLGPFHPSFDPSVFAPFAAPDWGYYLPGLSIIAPRPDLVERVKDEQLTGTVKLTYHWNDDVLSYISVGNGYKSGGTNTDRINPAFNPVFDAETALSYELGLKTDFPDQRVRMNLALHKTEIDDFQSNAFQGSGFNLQNAGKLDTYGGEIEIWWTPLDSVDLALSYVRSIADFKEFDQANCWVAYTFHTGIADPGRANPSDQFCDRSGGRVSFNPEDFMNLAATKRFELSDVATLSLRAEYSYIGDQMMDANNDPYKLQDSYGLLNVSIGVQLYDNTEIQFWGRNVTDERYYNVVFDVPLQDGKLNAYPGEPETWGMNFRYSF